MYRRPKFLEKLLEIRREMAAEADYDVVLFVEKARSGDRSLPAAETEDGHQVTKITKKRRRTLA